MKKTKLVLQHLKLGWFGLEEETLIWASGLDLVIGEEKRKFEIRLRHLYNKDRAPKVIGGQDEFETSI